MGSGGAGGGQERVGRLRAFHVSVVRPPGYAHASAFDEVAATLVHGFERLGMVASFGENELAGDAVNILLGAHLLESGHVDQIPLDRTVVYNLEPLVHHPAVLTPTYRALLGQAVVWDYSRENLAYLAQTLGVQGFFLPLGFVPELCRVGRGPQDIDVLFYGSLSARRVAVLEELRRTGLRVVSVFGAYGLKRDALLARAKVVLNVHYQDHSSPFEIVRVSYLLANRKAVVAECEDPAELPRGFERALAWGPYHDLVRLCREVATDDAWRAELEAAAYAVFSRICEEDLLRGVLRQMAAV